MITATGTICREAGPEDLPFVISMHYEAAVKSSNVPPEYQPSLRRCLDFPWFNRYLLGWMREGDRGTIAMNGGEEPIGAAWYRRFPPDEQARMHGGNTDFPLHELAIGIREEDRGRGVGEAILTNLLEQAASDGIHQLGLSVGDHNTRAQRLYTKMGFEVIQAFDKSSLMVAAI